MSFVKRTKPRVSASKISSVYDDENEDDNAAGPSRLVTTSSASTFQNDSRTSTPRRTLSKLGVDMDDEDAEHEADSSDVIFRPKARGVRGTPSSSSISKSSQAASFKERASVSAMDEDEEVDEGDISEIRRSKHRMASKEAKRSTTFGGILSTATTTTTPKRSTPLRPRSFQTQPPLSDASLEPSASGTVPNLYTSKYLEELRSSTPTTSASRSRAHSPTKNGPGTRIQDPMVSQTSRIALVDDSSDNALWLARSKFPDEFRMYQHDAIPSESMIRAVKEKRAKLRTVAAATGSISANDDFISLSPAPASSLAMFDRMGMDVDDGPHPHSRLQREEDEFGDGSEEFAEYTEANDRIPIGDKAEREYRASQRKEMAAAVLGRDDDDDDDDQDGVGIRMEEEMDEEEVEWEKAQLSRTQFYPDQSVKRSKEQSPYRSAPIPTTSTRLPSTSTCSTRLELTLKALEQSRCANEAVVRSTQEELVKLDSAEKENKADVNLIEDKIAWFDELEAFVTSLARLMDEKMDQVEEMEGEMMELLVKRESMLSSKRDKWLQDRFEVCFDFKPRMSIIISPASKIDENDEAMVSNARHSDENSSSFDDQQEKWSTMEKPWSQWNQLDEADTKSFQLAQDSILDQLNATFSDVQAVEYLYPSVSTYTTTTTTLPFISRVLNVDAAAGGMLHPRSVVSRFQELRVRYPKEYVEIWGGLSVAQIWEFYVRLELMFWDPLLVFSNQSRAIDEQMDVWNKEGASMIRTMHWFIGVSQYNQQSSTQAKEKEEEEEEEEEAVGGDDEMHSCIINNVVIEKKLMGLVGNGVYSPWSWEQTEEMVKLVEMIQTMLGLGENVKWESLIRQCLRCFEVQIERLKEVFSFSSPSKGNAEDVLKLKKEKAAKELVVEQLIEGLFKNLISWGKVIDPTTKTSSSSNTTTMTMTMTSTMVLGQTHMRLVEIYVVHVLEPLFQNLSSSTIGLHHIAKEAKQKVLETLLSQQDLVAKSDKLTFLCSHNL
ncbi:uncharacterized protein MEPE_02852 [Melanopsichium pennsylvanicum]|uniref:GCF C-terminal domain-containing protein n=1 Tax=Melanopsichium pennsylvanicum TaxID=63383 RepID=A0AAJ4XJZ5_9BASI|nr:uncharacterized protein MEPE_02852 [Melanopsichium pennsylvanicum]